MLLGPSSEAWLRPDVKFGTRSQVKWLGAKPENGGAWLHCP